MFEVLKKMAIRKKQLGVALFAALIIQYVLPVVKLGRFAWVATLIYLVVASYLTFS